MNQNETKLTGLPDGWKWVKLGEVCEKISLNNIKIKQKEYQPKGKYPVVDQGQDLIGGYYDDERLLIPNEPPYIIFGDHTKIKKYISFKFIAGADGVKVLKAKSSISPKFLYYSLLNTKIEDKGYARHFQLLEKLEYPLPPLSIQAKIVEKLEALLSELDKGKAQLLTAQAQLKTYRQAVLNITFVDNKGKPTTISQIVKKIQIGPFGSQLHQEDYISNGIPLINPTHIKENKIVADNTFSITNEKRNSLTNYILQKGDIIMGRRGEMGRCGLVGDKENGWFCGTGSLFIRPNIESADSKFLFYFLISQRTKKYLQENAAGTTMANLNGKIVNNIPINLPPLSIQEKIVQEIESRLSVCDKLEETIKTSLLQSETLRQSVLKRAFEGKLV